MESAAQTAHPLSFGPFALRVSERLLTKDGVAVQLGGRALDILIALVSRPNQFISKRELMAQVWPDVTVDEGSLRFHISSLRKALGDGKDGARYITTLAGRGYSFVAPVSRPHERDTLRVEAAGRLPHANLPSRLRRMIGRADGVLTLSAQLTAARFVTIVGSGGIGKTTVAIAVGHELLETFSGAVLFVDLGALSDPNRAATAIASMLGLSVQSDDPVPGLIFYLRDKRLLLILDNCEHLIDAAARLAASIFIAAPKVHILATSREALRVEGERVHRLEPLACPPEEPGLTAADALKFPAVQLFVERATASGAQLNLTDADAATVADICRRLDGVALAIELAARRVESYGLQQTATLLEERLSLLWLGQRTAPPRQKTLQATLDWSHGLLSDPERAVLRRLAVFVGYFTLDAALGVVTDATVGQVAVFAAIADLVGKSLVAVDIDAPVATYRLLDTTRAYALQKLAESGESAAVALRHAWQYRAALEAANSEWEVLPARQWVDRHRPLLPNAHAAMNWSVSAAGDAATGIALTVAAVPLWFQLSLLADCCARARTALALPPPSRTTRQEMLLHAALAWSLMQIKGSVPETQAAWATLLELSRQLDDTDHQLRALWGLWAAQINAGAFRASLALAEEFAALAGDRGTPADRCVADRMVGYSLHLLGDQTAARRHIEDMLAHYEPPVTGAQMIRFVFDQRATARCFLARIQWLQGYPDQATRTMRSVVESERSSGDTLSLCQVLVQAACPVGLMIGDLPAVAEFSTMLIDAALRSAWEFWHIWGQSFRGVLLVHSGEVDAGVTLLKTALAGLRGIGFGVYYIHVLGEFAAALGRAGDPVRGLDTIEQALARSQENEERWCIAELLRVKGELLKQRGAAAEADSAFAEAHAWAERQGALSWTLRIATSRARLWQTQGRGAEARDHLQTVCDRFTEGFGTADLRTAKLLLDELAVA